MESHTALNRTLVDDDELETPEKVYYLFGHDIRTISCLRSTIMTTFSAGIVTTLGSFLFTSDGFKSTRYGLLTSALLMTPLWLNCARKDLADAEAIHQARQRIKERTGEDYTILDSLESYGSDSYG